MRWLPPCQPIQCKKADTSRGQNCSQSLTSAPDMSLPPPQCTPSLQSSTPPVKGRQNRYATFQLPIWCSSSPSKQRWVCAHTEQGIRHRYSTQSPSLALPLWVAAFSNWAGWELGAATSQTAPQGSISHEDGYQSVQMSSTFSTAVLTQLSKTP